MPVDLEPYIPEERFEGERILRHKVHTDFLFYAEHNLKITTKEGTLAPFILNKAQCHIHDTIEKQRKATGSVRVLVVKARQQGCSTYTAGRYYWQVTKKDAVNAFVLSHAQDTTRKLFRITRRYHDHCLPELKQRTNAASATEFEFAALDSSYYVGTAGAKEVGRGGTVHYFHGSEVAHWPNADMHFSGIMQSIPTGDFSKGSEVILESTANGMTGKFYDMVMDAERGESEYKVIFTPWYWQDEYRQTAPVDWIVPDDDQDYQKVYNLTIDQMWWRQVKTRELGSEWRFKQEYPATLEEAFQTSGEESFISPQLIMSIRVPKEELLDGMGPKIGACDPAWKGDRAGLGYRQGKRVKEILYYKDKDPTELANICKDYIIKNDLDRLFVDVIGIGAGVYSNLKAAGFGDIVKPCNFSNKSTDMNQDGTPKYLNHRAECWGRMKEDMEEGEYEIPNSDELASDLMAPQYHYNNSRGALQLESKKEMRLRGVASPDGGDVIAMTYSEKVHHTLRSRKKSAMIIPDYDVLEM